MLARRLTGTEPRIREVVPDADLEIADICDRAMSHRASDRFATAADFRAALEGYLARTSPRVGAREVGQFVEELFTQEREKIRLIIDEQMKQLQREASTAMPLPVPTLEPFDDTRPTTVRTAIALRDEELITVSARFARPDRYVWVTSEQPGSNEWSLFLATTLDVIERGETGIAGQVKRAGGRGRPRQQPRVPAALRDRGARRGGGADARQLGDALPAPRAADGGAPARGDRGVVAAREPGHARFHGADRGGPRRACSRRGSASR